MNLFSKPVLALSDVLLIAAILLWTPDFATYQTPSAVLLGILWFGAIAIAAYGNSYYTRKHWGIYEREQETGYL